MDKKILADLYLKKRYSAVYIAEFLSCSPSKINYWLSKHSISKRSISEGVYAKRNPNGDPFTLSKIVSRDKAFLHGLGLGLYWGEGTKRSLSSVRLGNTDPHLIKKFIEFLERIYAIDSRKLRFGLQLFNDSSIENSLEFWCKELGASPEQFQKPTISVVRGPGSYRNKSQHGVLTVYFNNTKLRDIIVGSIEKLKDA